MKDLPTFPWMGKPCGLLHRDTLATEAVTSTFPIGFEKKHPQAIRHPPGDFFLEKLSAEAEPVGQGVAVPSSGGKRNGISSHRCMPGYLKQFDL